MKYLTLSEYSSSFYGSCSYSLKMGQAKLVIITIIIIIIIVICKTPLNEAQLRRTQQCKQQN